MNTNNVTIKESWNLVDFMKKFTKLKFAKGIDADGEPYNSLAFIDKNDKITFCHFGKSVQGITPEQIKFQANILRVGLNSNGKYTLFRENTWENIVL